MSASYDPSRILSFDLELSRDGRFRQLGAQLGERTLRCSGKADAALRALDELAAEADYVLGHNVLDFDLPWLSGQTEPPAQLLAKPVLDTLYLSPLAFPANPYHRLIKDYKLVRDSYNDPLADARLALSILEEQRQALASQHCHRPELVQLYRLAFSRARVGSLATEGLAAVLADVAPGPMVPLAMLPSLVKAVAAEKACPQQLSRLLLDVMGEGDTLLPLAYVCAWLQVAGGNSVLPPWIWHRFPRAAAIIAQLREQHCGEADCAYCRHHHDARGHLRRLFELEDFRALPDGRPLQRELIEAGMVGSPLLGILPTSGGKSLCYQLPALVRNQRTGALTVVISPLQALMKDQVDNLRNKAGIQGVAAIYGMLTLPERGAILEQVRMGDIALLYLSPEQLRNSSVKKALAQRQLGGWVFDEAHCLSKWGHDFRPDYLHCARVIGDLARLQRVPLPPVFCYTATAKLDVVQDILGHFRQELEQELTCFQGGVERTNLRYEVVETGSAGKTARILGLLEDFFGEEAPGSCVIYCATRKGAEQLADILAQSQLLPVAAFHAGLDSGQKKEMLEAFVEGRIRVICATNAFGMGIDKDDVRLVIHADIPGSLENYLQEAGRAGRDRQQARCVLLFDEQDIEKQFRLGAMSELRHRDIAQLLRGIRYKTDPDQPLVITPGELLRLEQVETDFGTDDSMADTKVKTAIAWLERSGFVLRQDNVTQVFQGKPLFATLEEARQRLTELQLPPSQRELWLLVLDSLLNLDMDDGISADHIAEQVGCYLKDESRRAELTTTAIMRVLAQMADAGLLSKGLLMTAWLRPRGRDNAEALASTILALERELLALLQEQEPDPLAQPVMANLRLLNQALLDRGHDKSHPELLRNILKSWAQDGRVSGNKGALAYRYISRELYRLEFRQDWRRLGLMLEQRQQATALTLAYLYGCVAEAERGATRKVMLEFSLEGAVAALAEDMDMRARLAQLEGPALKEKLLAAVERSLLYLHEQHVITLQNGLAVFRQAMTLHLTADKGQRYTKADYEPLAQHYRQKVIQVHVMNEYARIGLDRMKQALDMVREYFEHESGTFLQRYFKGRQKILGLATSESSWKKIVESLHNPDQERIVQAPTEQNLLVLAGPGAGKTRVIVHRCAYLVRVCQVAPERILVLSFNHNAALSLRRRLHELLGSDARRLAVHTFHGLALRLTGQSLAERKNEPPDFDALLEQSIQLLEGGQLQLGDEQESQREQLLGGLEYLLVDEYQDIDERQYRLIAALVGRQLQDDEVRLRLMAVGDDDQSIYQFRQANVTFIRRFREDYEAELHYLTQNYRSSGHIITAANSLITHNRDRMKGEHPITIDHGRRLAPDGGDWQERDPLGRGRVEWWHCADLEHQAQALVALVERIRAQDPDCLPEQIAVLSRHGLDKEVLILARSALSRAGVPCRFVLDREQGFPLHRCRELVRYRDWLTGLERQLVDAAQLLGELPAEGERNHWQQLLADLVEQWRQSHGEQGLPAWMVLVGLNEYLLEQRRQVRFGRGLLLSTVHGVKGEEFRHVVVLDGGWQAAARQPEQGEEECRLYYVAMTRAIERLYLFQAGTEGSHPHLHRLDPGAFFRAPVPLRRPAEPTLRYSLLGMVQLFLDHAGRLPADHSAHGILAQLEVGDEVTLSSGERGEVLVLCQGRVVACLSRAAAGQWRSRLGQVRKAEVVALIQRRREDVKEDYFKAIKTELWYLPILQLCWQESAEGGERHPQPEPFSAR